MKIEDIEDFELEKDLIVWLMERGITIEESAFMVLKIKEHSSLAIGICMYFTEE